PPGTCRCARARRVETLAGQSPRVDGLLGAVDRGGLRVFTRRYRAVASRRVGDWAKALHPQPPPKRLLGSIDLRIEVCSVEEPKRMRTAYRRDFGQGRSRDRVKGNRKEFDIRLNRVQVFERQS